MANRERGELRLVARHRSYTLRLTTGACCALEDQAGRRLSTVIDGVNQGAATDVRWLTWAAMQARHAGEVLTRQDAGQVIDEAGGLRRIVPILGAFMDLNADDPGEDTGRGGEADSRQGSQWRRIYLDARGAGMAPETFWALSLRELWLELAATRQRQKQARDRDLGIAWWVASLSRQERLPSLSTILGRQERAQAKQTSQSWQDMKVALKALTGGAHAKGPQAHESR